MERFFSKTAWVGDCLIWQNPSDPDGYGSFYYKGKTRRAHRVSYELANGQFDYRLLVRHTCDTKLCVNPKHLILGTNADNSKDASDRGLLPRGESQWSAKLTEQQVVKIREDYAVGRKSVDLAAEYGMHRAVIADIVFGRHWKHVGGPIQKSTKRQKLTDEQVSAIVEATHTMSDQSVADKFNISQPYVTRLKNGNRRNGIRPSRHEEHPSMGT